MNIDNIKIRNKLIVIVGPTASGKTSLSIELAKKYNAEIINADAFQVYKNMDIGTAKITQLEKEGIKHHLIDIIEYDEEFNVNIFQSMAREIIDERLKNNQYTIVVGGSNLYVQALLYNYNFNENTEFKKMITIVEKLSLTQLQQEVVENKITLNNSDYNNKKRLVRIISKLRLGLNIENNNEKKPYYKDFDLIGVYQNREVLYERINKRVDIMIEQGLIDEVAQFDSEKISQQAIGYKEVHSFLKNEKTIEQTVELIKKNSRNYAKRQLTWYNNKMEVTWYKQEGDIWKNFLIE